MVCSSAAKTCAYVKSTDAECNAFFATVQSGADYATLIGETCDLGKLNQYKCSDATKNDQSTCEAAGGAWSTEYKCGITECVDAVVNIEQAAVAAGRGDCSNVKGTTAVIEMTCLEDDSGKTCGGTSGFITLLNSIVAIATGASQDALKSFCTDQCFEKGMSTFSRVAGPESDNLNTVVEMMCVTDMDTSDGTTRYCWGDVNSFLMGMNEGTCSVNDASESELGCESAGGKWTSTMMTKSYFDQNVCNAGHQCVQKGMIAMGSSDPSRQARMEAFAEFTCLRNNNLYCMLGMMGTDAPIDNACGKCSDTDLKTMDACEEAGTCSGGVDDNQLVDDCTGTWTRNTWNVLQETASTPVEWDACKTQLAEFEDLGCCINSIVDSGMLDEDMSVGIKNLFKAADISMPAACSLDAVTFPTTIAVTGMSVNQCKAFKPEIAKDLALAAGTTAKRFSGITCEPAENRFRALQSGSVCALTTTFTNSEPATAEKIKENLKAVTFPKTSQAAAKQGMTITATGEGTSGNTEANAAATGTVVSNPKDPSDLDGAGNTGVALLAAVAPTLAAILAQLA